MAAKKAAKPTMAQAFKAAQKSVPTKIAPPRGGGAGGGTKPPKPKGPAGQAEDAIEQAVKDAAGVVAGVIKNAGKGADKVGDKVASIIDGALKVLNSDGPSMLKLEPGKGKGKGKGKSMLVPEPKAPKRGGQRQAPPTPDEYPMTTLPKTL